MINPETVMTARRWALPQFSAALAVMLAGAGWLLAPHAAWSSGLILTLALFLAWWEPAWVLVLLALVAPFEQPAVVWLGGTVYTTEVLLVCACAGAVWHWGRQRAWRHSVVNVYGWALPFAGVVILSALLAHHPAAWKGAVRWFEWIAALLLSVHLLRRGGEAQRVLIALAMAAVVSAAVGLLQVWRGPSANPDLATLQWSQREIVRAAGEYGANTLAMFLALVLPWMLSAIVWPARRMTQVLAMGGAVVVVAAWVLTFSGTGIAALGVAGVIMGWGYFHRRHWNPFWLLGFLTAGLAVLVLTHQGWLDAEFLKYKITSLQDRLDYLAVAGRLFQRAPWFGIGPGMYRWLAPTWGGGVNPIGVLTHPHSLYLSMLVELGAVGLALGLSAIFRLLRHLFQRADAMRDTKAYFTVWACAAGIGGVAVANLLDHGLIHDRGVHLALWIGAALVWAQKPPRPRAERRQRFEGIWQAEPMADSAAAWEERLAERRSGRAPFYALLDRALADAPHAEILELGCGPALDAVNLAKNRDWSVHALDFSSRALEHAAAAAKALGRNLELHQADVRHTVLPGGCFDLVFSQGLLEHFPDPAPVWHEMQRLAKPGGYILVDVPQTWNPYTLAKQWHFFKGDWPWGWETQYTLGELARAGEAHGLVLAGASGYGYRGGPADVTLRLRQWLQPHFPEAWDRLEKNMGRYWMMNVAALFQKK
jgi:SAM-dependent methyltransferase